LALRRNEYADEPSALRSIPNRHLQRLVAAPSEAADVIGPFLKDFLATRDAGGSMIIFIRSGQ
jgi:hypothetical protein